MKSEALYSELKYVLDNFVSPMLKVFQSLSSHINALSSDPDKLSTLFEAVYYIVEIFYSLSSIELPEMIEDALESWFSEFHNYLQQEAPALDSRTSDDEATQLDNVKASICETLRMFAEKYEEEFQPYVSTFAHDVWNLLIKTDLREGKDSMAVSAMGFLTTLARGVHHKLFQDPGTLEQICAKIVIPNMKFRSEDEQMFEINPMEYMRRDIEGSDSDTRRRMAMELVKSLSERFSDTVTPALTSYITTLLQEYATTPQSKWKDKDTALQLALSLLARQVTSARGATQLNELVNLHDFFNSHVAPELTAGAGNAPAVVQADALKFFTVFRSQLDKQVRAPPFALSRFRLLNAHLSRPLSARLFQNCFPQSLASSERKKSLFIRMPLLRSNESWPSGSHGVGSTAFPLTSLPEVTRFTNCSKTLSRTCLADWKMRNQGITPSCFFAFVPSPVSRVHLSRRNQLTAERTTMS